MFAFHNNDMYRNEPVYRLLFNLHISCENLSFPEDCLASPTSSERSIDRIVHRKYGQLVFLFLNQRCYLSMQHDGLSILTL